MYNSYESTCGFKSLNARVHCMRMRGLGRREFANFLKDLLFNAERQDPEDHR